MKYENLFYGLGSILVIVGAILKILHMSPGNEIFLVGIIWTFLFQEWHVIQLKKRIKELENK